MKSKNVSDCQGSEGGMNNTEVCKAVKPFYVILQWWTHGIHLSQLNVHHQKWPLR
jgi:hypothetical protein